MKDEELNNNESKRGDVVPPTTINHGAIASAQFFILYSSFLHL